ncbi:MAG: hypothetical protein WC779_08710, partial [Candidatus Omnitrophota bacterium]
MKRMLTVSVIIALVMSIASFAFAADTFIKYPSNNWLRKTLSGTSFCYEYKDEALHVDKWNSYGRIILGYESAGAYKTWDWNDTTSQVVMTEYAGDYVPTSDVTFWSDVVQSERRVAYIYDFHGELNNLDTATNGWVMREKTIYDNDGVTMKERYVYDASGLMVRDDHAADNRYYTYVYHSAPLASNIHYKSEYELSSGNLISTYEYISSEFYVRRDPDGTIYTITLDGATSYTNSQLDPDGTFTIYQRDASHVFQGAIKYLPNGDVERLNATWGLIGKTEASAFLKGVNIPWVSYGYGIGAAPVTGTHVGLSSKLHDLYAKLDGRKGDYARVFLFSDLRAGIEFDASGNPTGFTAKVYEDMQALLDAAKALGIKLMPVLFDYKIADGISVGEAEHADLINDAAKRLALINIIDDFIAHFGADSSIYAWDIMNEPEVSIEKGATNLANLQAFVGAFTTMIHANAPGAKVTVGSLNRGNVANWMGLGLDFYQYHYYNYMEANGYPLDYKAADLGLDKPVIVGELEPTDVLNKLNTVSANGYAGALFWEDGSGFNISAADYALIQDWGFGTSYT